MTENIKKWACSFSGCDGGNSNADIWLCGIEWGSGSEEEEKYYKELPNKINKGAVEIKGKKFDWKDSITYTYDRSFAKLYTAIQDGNITDYKNVKELSGDELFKLNLYHIAFDFTDHSLWQKYKLNEITGFKNKYLFNIWCFFNRFPFFSKTRKENNPKLIICTGVDYLRDFLMCFGAENFSKIQTDIIKAQSTANEYDKSYYWVKVDKTLLIVIPFFSGRYGLNSDYLLQEMGNKIRGLLNSRA